MDNYAVDDYYYLLTVHTGLRKGAGTKSKVSFCMAGSLEETGVRVLSDGVREVSTLSSCLILSMLHRSLSRLRGEVVLLKTGRKVHEERLFDIINLEYPL